MNDKSLLITLGFRSEENSSATDGYVVAVDFDKLPDDLDKQIKDFGIDAVYLNTDEDENGNRHSFPAVFLKNVKSFDNETLEQIAEIHKKIWNYKKVLFLYIYSDVEIRIYNCSEKPLIKTDENFDYAKALESVEIKTYTFSDKEQLQELNNLFSRIAIDTGIIWTIGEAQFIRDKINLQRRVDKYLIESLVRVTEKLNGQGLQIDFIHKIILRSLFLLYLEDRGATDEKFYSTIIKGAKTYFDILENVDATYRLFESLEHYFNGNVFTLERENGNITEKISLEQLNLIKKCFICGYEDTAQTQLFEESRLFDFSIIQIELLSEIYEKFLFKTDPKLKKNTGTYYTPPSLVEFVLNEKLPTNNNNDTNYNVKILDLSCGSGIYLVESFKRLVKRYENAHNTKLSNFDKLKKILTDNIFGIELHPQAIKIAAFSLYLALVDNLDPKTLWQEEKHKLPYLINDPNETDKTKQGNNLFCRDTISDISEITELQNFDLVVGNPPFGRLISREDDKDGQFKNIREYCTKYNFAKEMVLPFLHKAAEYFVAQGGQIALIFNTKVLTNTESTWQNFRKWLFNECDVEKVYNFSILRNAPKNFGGQLFDGATGPISIVYYQKKQPQSLSDKIVYYAPKTYIKSNIIEGLSIDFTDLKYLPREECQKPDTKIWKIAMWGGMNDWELINKFGNANFENIDTFTQKHNIKSGVGFQLLTQKKDKPKYSDTLTKLPYVDTNFITKYYTKNDLLSNVKDSIKTEKSIKFYKELYQINEVNKLQKLTDFRRLGDIEAFINPHIIIKKGLEENRVCASFIDTACSFRDGVYGFYSNNIDDLLLLMSYVNSKISTYYLFMTISSYGIEREQIMKNEYLSIPINLKISQQNKVKDITKQIIENFKTIDFFRDISKEKETNHLINEIDKIIYESLDLSQSEILLINDTISINLDLFHKQEKSKALHPANQEQVQEYAKIISQELNDFLEEPDFFANATVYQINKFTPLMMIKLSFENKQKDVERSTEKIDIELKKLDKQLWEKKATNIYFRKKLNYTDDDDVFIIRPNQRRFWSPSIAIEDATELILEILNEN